jgi:crossover junction endodeoxyribonuclease RuvC
VRVFGIDPGSLRTGYGCIDSDGRRHELVICGAIRTVPRSGLPERLHHIHDELGRLIERHHPDCVVVENLFHARNVKSALVLGHARGVAVLAAVRAGIPVVEYTPAEIKASVAGYGRAGKSQMGHMVKALLGLASPPRPHDAADALAVAMCHVHATGHLAGLAGAAARAPRHLRSWRNVTVDQLAQLSRRRLS